MRARHRRSDKSAIYRLLHTRDGQLVASEHQLGSRICTVLFQKCLAEVPVTEKSIHADDPIVRQLHTVDLCSSEGYRLSLKTSTF
jgi:hypothetical protein